MRGTGGQHVFEAACKVLQSVHKEAIKEYGSDNAMRLTGKHETQSIKKFSYGVSDRGASIRIPVATVNNNWVGYLEDRRPASNADPYKVIAHIVGALLG
jgi:glutamine synthetase